MSPARWLPALSAVFALGAALAYFEWGDVARPSLQAPQGTPEPAPALAVENESSDDKLANAAVQKARSPSPPASSVEDEASSMQRLRALRTSSPLAALSLADELEARFPDGSSAAERAYLKVRSLADLGRFHEARERAQAMLARFPDHPYALEVQRHLLVHPLDMPSREEQQRALLDAPKR